MVNPGNKNKKQERTTVVRDMPDYHSDPVVVAMVERARAFLKKAGLPKGWAKPKTSN